MSLLLPSAFVLLVATTGVLMVRLLREMARGAMAHHAHRLFFRAEAISERAREERRPLTNAELDEYARLVARALEWTERSRA